MILLLLALASVTAPKDYDFSKFLERDAAARTIAQNEAKPLFDRVKASWHRCLVTNAKRMSTSRDAPNFVATAALARCAEWEPAILQGLPSQIALGVTSMPFKDAFRIAEENAPEHLTRMKDGARDQLIAVVVEARMPKAKKR